MPLTLIITLAALDLRDPPRRNGPRRDGVQHPGHRPLRGRRDPERRPARDPGRRPSAQSSSCSPSSWPTSCTPFSTLASATRVETWHCSRSAISGSRSVCARAWCRRSTTFSSRWSADRRSGWSASRGREDRHVADRPRPDALADDGDLGPDPPRRCRPRRLPEDELAAFAEGVWPWSSRILSRPCTRCIGSAGR